MPDNIILEEAHQLAKQLFHGNKAQESAFINRLLDTYVKTENSQFLLIHNPGGWGSTRVENLLQWERSIIEGVDATIREMGYEGTLIQYFRSKTGIKAISNDIREQMKFFAFKANVLSEELKFITKHRPDLKIVLIGVSQGAAFSNAVQQYLNGESKRVFSIEIGTPFFYKKKRKVTERTLTLDNNGLMPDSLMEWNVRVILTTYFTAPFRWLKYRINGEKVKFTYCINVPGHDYNWDYPEVRGQIAEFLKLKFGQKSDVEVVTQ